jgi:SOS-response transcriptional repressor LexA
MNKAGIDDGDLVIVDADAHPSNGQIVIIYIDHEYTMKRFYKNDEQITLMPDSQNPKHTPMMFDTKKCEIILRGVVEAVHWKKIK